MDYWSSIIDSVTSLLGLTALVVLAVCFLAIPMTKGTHHIYRSGLFLIIVLSAILLVYKVASELPNSNGVPNNEQNGMLEPQDGDDIGSKKTIGNSESSNHKCNNYAVGGPEDQLVLMPKPELELCIPSDGWFATSMSGVRQDRRTGSRYVDVRYFPDEINGRVYLLDIEMEISRADKLLVTGIITTVRPETSGRNPRTGELITIPASVRVLGRVSKVSFFDEKTESKGVSNHTSDELKQYIITTISSIYGVPSVQLDDNTRFAEDLPPRGGLGSVDLGIVELVMAVEGFADCEIPDDIIDELYTIQEFVKRASVNCLNEN